MASKGGKDEEEFRCVGAACGDGCFDTVTMPIINILHQQFWAIGDFGLQNAYIQKNVHLMPSKRRRAVQNPTADLHHQW